MDTSSFIDNSDCLIRYMEEKRGGDSEKERSRAVEEYKGKPPVIPGKKRKKVKR